MIQFRKAGDQNRRSNNSALGFHGDQLLDELAILLATQLCGLIFDGLHREHVQGNFPNLSNNYSCKQTTFTKCYG